MSKEAFFQIAEGNHLPKIKAKREIFAGTAILFMDRAYIVTQHANAGDPIIAIQEGAVTYRERFSFMNAPIGYVGEVYLIPTPSVEFADGVIYGRLTISPDSYGTPNILAGYIEKWDFSDPVDLKYTLNFGRITGSGGDPSAAMAKALEAEALAYQALARFPVTSDQLINNAQTINAGESALINFLADPSGDLRVDAGDPTRLYTVNPGVYLLSIRARNADRNQAVNAASDLTMYYSDDHGIGFQGQLVNEPLQNKEIIQLVRFSSAHPGIHFEIHNGNAQNYQYDCWVLGFKIAN